MRLMKMFGIAAMMALAVMAFAGVSSAAAEQKKAVELCKANEEDCSKANQYGVPTTVKGKVIGKAVLKGAFEVTCSVSNITGKTTEQKETELLGEITSATFEKCEGGCTSATSENLPWSQQITVSFPPLSVNLQIHFPKVNLHCFFGLVQCKFTAETVNLEMQGGNPGTVVASNEPLEVVESPEVCGKTGTWTAKYEITEPKPVWISYEKEV